MDTPSQNGIAKRKNKHLLETARALLFQIHVPKHLWVDAIFTTCFLINRMPSSVITGQLLIINCFLIIPCFLLSPRFWNAHVLFGMSDHKSLSAFFWVTLMFKKGIDVIVLLFDNTLCLLMLHFLEYPFFPLFYCY